MGTMQCNTCHTYHNHNPKTATLQCTLRFKDGRAKGQCNVHPAVLSVNARSISNLELRVGLSKQNICRMRLLLPQLSTVTTLLLGCQLTNKRNLWNGLK